MVNLNKKTFFLITIIVLLLLFSYCILLYNSQQKKIDELSNQFYTKHHVALFDSELQHWTTSTIKNLDYRVFVEYDDSFRFFIQDSGSWQPPMFSGRFFMNNESGKKAVVGREMQDHIKEYRGKQYINFQGESYEVIGIVGDSFVSHADYLILLSSQELPQSVNTRVIVDGDSSSVVHEVAKYMTEKYKSISQAELKVRGTAKSTHSTFFNKVFLLNSMFLIICSLFFCLRYWFETEKKRLYVYFLLGVPRRITNFNLYKEIFTLIIISSFASVILFYFFQPQFFSEMYIKILYIIILFVSISLFLLSVFLFGERLQKKQRKWGSSSDC